MFRKLAIAAVVATGLTASTDAHAAVNKCKVRGSTTLAQSPLSRAYDQGGTVIACMKKTGQRTTLDGVTAGTDVVKVAGAFVAFGSGTTVNVQRITDGAIPKFMPTDTGGQVRNIVLKNNGAAAWAVTPLDDEAMTYVQGNERSNHTPQLFSDNEMGGVDPASLRSLPGTDISWTYDDGTTDTASLFAGPAEVF